MFSWKYLALIGAGTLAFAAWAGYRLECRVMDSAGSKPVTLQSIVRRVTAPKSRTEHVDKLNEIRHRAGRTELSIRETAAAWELIRGFTAEDVKACLEEIPVEPPRPANESLIGMLFYRWGQIDPEAAAEVASQPPYEERLTALISMATPWAQRDAEGALRWAAKLGPSSAQNMIGNAAGKMLVLQNPATALDRALTEFPAGLNGVIIALAMRPDSTGEMRGGLAKRLAGLPDLKPLRLYLNRLAWRARADPELSRTLIGELEQAGVAEEHLAKLRQSVSYSGQRYDPQAALEGAQGVDAKAQKSQYRNWSASDPEKAVAWAAQNQRTDLVAEAVKSQSMSLLRSNWQPGVRDERGSPWVKGVVSQYETWRKLEPAAAESWLKTMPADIRNHLSPDHAAH